MKTITIRTQTEEQVDFFRSLLANLRWDVEVDYGSDGEEVEYINGHRARKGSGLRPQDIEELRDIFTGTNIDARKLRREAWRV